MFDVYQILMTIMDESWENLVSYMENDDCHVFNEHDISSLMEEFMEDDSVHAELYLKSHSYDSNLTHESTTLTMGISSLEEINTGLDNSTFFKQLQHVSSEKSISSSMVYTLPFEDCTTVPNILKETCQYHGKHSNDMLLEKPDIKKPKRGRSTSQTQDHILAERKRRENLARMFIALSATIPGLKKVDKVSILNKAIDHVKFLQERVKDLEEENKKRKIEPRVCFKINKTNVNTMFDDFSCTTDDHLDRPIKICPKVEARVSAKDVLIRVMCEKQKGIVPKILAKLEAHNLSIVCSNVLPFGKSTLNITSIAQMDQELSMTMEDDLLKLLIEDLLNCCNLQQ